MNKGSRMLRRALIAGVLCIVVATVASVAWAVTSANGKIVACAKKSNGDLRLVGAAKDCRKTERAVTWNTTGPQGPRGPAGPPGEAGADGLDGEDGVDGDDGEDGLDGDDGAQGPRGPQGPAGPGGEPKWRYVFLNTSIAPYASGAIATDSCTSPVPQAVNGGGSVVGSSVAVAGAPDVQYGNTASRWLLQFGTNNSPLTKQVTVWVLCANGTAG